MAIPDFQTIMVDFDLCVSTEARYEVQRLDTDYFDEQGI